jgi:squalene-hopene/tetraprenyl-beta-curcumene cyclase
MLLIVFDMVALAFQSSTFVAQDRVVDARSDWNPAAAGKYLDDRMKVWFARARCVSCHTGLPYALARPALRKLVGDRTPSEPETQLLAQIRRRVADWRKLDTKGFPLYYDANDTLKTQSWGTEAVFNAVILAFDDQYQGRSSPSEATAKAFVNLWETQLQVGDNKGTWEWLDFNEAPWGNVESRYFGAALAAIAVGTAPGYLTSPVANENGRKVELLRRYLQVRLPKQDLHNQVWGLWAATKVEGILTPAQRQKLVDQLLGKQRDDGGWSLSSLGTWVRADGTAQDAASDGYATALILHVLQTAGVRKEDAKTAKGLDWLQRSQAAAGAWRNVSLVKQRDPATHEGQFMSDAATAFAVLALGH